MAKSYWQARHRADECNGLRLLTLCSEHNLTITNNVFQQPTRRKVSWCHPRSKQWHLLDYVIVRQRDLRDVHLIRAMRGAECWTDHNMIRSCMKLRIRPLARMQAPRKRLNVALLRDPLRQHEFRLYTDRFMDSLNPTTTDIEDVGQAWLNFIDELSSATHTEEP